MKLDGQSQSGYAMAALLVAMSVMAVLMTVAMPVWRQATEREKEEELVFRGKQYARAIGLFERKYGNTPPPTLDVLVQEKFLRKKYKDPITGGDFVAIPAAQAQGANPGAPAAQRGPAQALQQATNQTMADAQRQLAGRGGVPGTAGGGVIGVTSASTARSIRIYNGGTRYSEWRFVYAPPAATPGAGAPAAGAPGGRGGQGRQGNQPAQPGNPPFGPAAGRGRGPVDGPARGTGPGGRGGAPQGPAFPIGRGR